MIIGLFMLKEFWDIRVENISLKPISSRHLAPQNTKNDTILNLFFNRSVQIYLHWPLSGIGGELGVPCITNRLYGRLNSLGRRKRSLGSCARTLMSRPHMTRVSWTVSGGKRELNNWGIRSGRERSSPTRGHECCGVAGWRKCMDLALRYERPPLDLPLRWFFVSTEFIFTRSLSDVVFYWKIYFH